MQRTLLASIGMVIIVFCAMFSSGCDSDDNHNEVLLEKISPNSEYKAVVFNRNFGATTEKNFQLSIIKNGERLPDEAGNIFISYSDFEIEWLKDDELRVTAKKNTVVFKQKNMFDQIIIKYVYE